MSHISLSVKGLCSTSSRQQAMPLEESFCKKGLICNAIENNETVEWPANSPRTCSENKVCYRSSGRRPEMQLVRKPGFAPGPSASRAEMLLLHHNPDLNWSPWSDSHRRIRVYETRPVAAEAQGRGQIRKPNSEDRTRSEIPRPGTNW